MSVIFCSLQKDRNSSAVKLVPLSVMMLLGTPKRYMMDLMKLTAVVAVEFVMGTASIHLVNLSTATRRCVPSFGGFSERPNHIEPPLGERPGEWYCLQCGFRCMRLCCEFLAADAFSDDGFCVLESCGPVEACSKSFGH